MNGCAGHVLAVQRDLYHMMADLAMVPEAATRAPGCLRSGWAGWRQATNELGAEVEMPRAFIIAGDSLGGATLDVARDGRARAPSAWLPG